jgi:L-iditol 2-dehydrogenase
VFLTAGADATIDLAIKNVRDGGKIIVFASTPKNMGFANNEIYYRELTVMGSYSPSPADLKDSIELLSSAQVNVKNISTVYELDDIETAFYDTINNTILKAYIKI